MFSLLKNHPRAVLWAAIVHVVFLVMMGISFHFIDAPTVSSPEVKVVTAVLKDDSIAQKKLKKKLEAAKRKKDRIEKKRKKALKIKKEKKRAAELKKKKLAKMKADKQRIEEEHQRQIEAENKRIEAENKRVEEQKQREDKLKKELEEERQRIAAEQEVRNETLISKQLGLIKSRIEQRWIKPASTKVGMVCTIRVSLIPSGEVIDVQYLKRSGNDAFDRSVYAAVQRASPLPLLPVEYGLSDRFRKIELNFGQR